MKIKKIILIEITYLVIFNFAILCIFQFTGSQESILQLEVEEARSRALSPARIRHPLTLVRMRSTACVVLYIDLYTRILSLITGRVMMAVTKLFNFGSCSRSAEYYYVISKFLQVFLVLYRSVFLVIF